jgi:hypothetical protein
MAETPHSTPADSVVTYQFDSSALKHIGRFALKNITELCIIAGCRFLP